MHEYVVNLLSNPQAIRTNSNDEAGRSGQAPGRKQQRLALQTLAAKCNSNSFKTVLHWKKGAIRSLGWVISFLL
jgi:hypothetical protein